MIRYHLRGVAVGFLTLATACTAQGPRAGLIPRPRTPRDAVVARLQDSVRAVMVRAMADSAFPGGVAVVGNRAGVLTTFAIGKLDAADPTVPSLTTLYDLASLTKVIATTTLMLQLVDAGTVSLTAPVTTYLPEWRGNGASAVTIRHLLTHSSGLAAWRPFYKEAADRADARAQLMTVSPDVAPDQRYLYSDMNFMLLGMVIERVTGLSLDAAFAQRVATPLRLRDTRFRPDSTTIARTAPTEFDPWRQRQPRGEVHDENAARFDGVSGHAGLFATAEDLTRIARLWLSGGSLDGVRFAAPATVRQFTTVHNLALSHRALGWETPNGTNSAGRRLSPKSFGHTGFTGTSIWMDPERDLFVVLLTNRVNPTRRNTRIGGVRTGLAEAVVGALEGQVGGRPSQR